MNRTGESNHSKRKWRRPDYGRRHAIACISAWVLIVAICLTHRSNGDATYSAEEIGYSEVISMRTYYDNIRPFVMDEIDSAKSAETQGDAALAFAHLERAHVLGQRSTRLHVFTHWKMFCWALRNRVRHEIGGQLWRMLAAATTTIFGLPPTGNTGGSNVSSFQRMAVPPDLQAHIDAALQISEAVRAPNPPTT